MSSVKGAMRLVEEKYAMNEIDIIIWSNKIDLLALSNVKGDQSLQLSVNIPLKYIYSLHCVFRRSYFAST